jgi:glutamyl-tRNA synthetase/glutamyl-Q tRNA(Asp) synthetase
MTLTRFAPAPTGYLHLGHVLNAQTVWSMARDAGARVLLRIEDHDRERCRPEYERAILEDLDWLGFVPDLFPTDAFRAGRCESRQSDRASIYEAAALRLEAEGLLYGCTCKRAEIYPGTCRERSIALGPGVAWRVRLDRRTESFADLLLGPQTQTPTDQCGDVAIRDRLGNWTYQFVVSVDDFTQGVDLVIRGRDLLESTGRQIQLGRLLGRATPATFAHHQLVMKSPTQKLSKSDGDTGIRDLRRRGLTRDDVLAMIGSLT